MRRNLLQQAAVRQKNRAQSIAAQTSKGRTATKLAQVVSRNLPQIWALHGCLSFEATNAPFNTNEREALLGLEIQGTKPF